MAGSGDLAPLLIIVEEVFKLLLLTAVKLCFLPLRWLHPRKEQMYATGTAFITGCDTGIGRATAVMLADKGWKVFAGVLLPDSESELSKVSTIITPILMDVTDESSIRSAASQVSAAVGEDGLQLLLNNAGIADMAAVECCDVDKFRKVLDVNVTGVLATSKHFIPLLRKGRRKGRIVTMGSVSGHLPLAFWSPYSTSKHAVEGLTDCMRYELEPQGIQVILIKPGPIKTPIWPSEEEARQRTDEMLATEDAKKRYGADATAMTLHVARMGKAGLPVADVLDVIHHAATCSNPKHRYLVGPTSSTLYWLKKVLPDEAFSTMMTRLVSDEMMRLAADDAAGRLGAKTAVGP